MESTCTRTYTYRYIRGTAVKLRELSHAGVSGMYSCIHVPNVNLRIIISFISSYLISWDTVSLHEHGSSNTFMLKLYSLTRIKKKKKNEHRSNTEAIFLCLVSFNNRVCSIDITSFFQNIHL